MILPIVICLFAPMSWGLIEPILNSQGEVAIDKLAQHMTSMEYLMQNLTFQVQRLTSQINSMKQKQDAVVSFKAYISQDRQFTAGSTIIFDHTENNIGGGYNSASGVFHAPISGLYTFSAQVETLDVGVSEYFIINEGLNETIFTVNEPFATSSTSAIFHVSRGNDVFVKKTYDDGKNARLRGYVWTEFSGHLLRAD